MRHGFVVGRIGLLVGYAEFRGARGLEAGARVELRRMGEQLPSKRNGAEPATPVIFGDAIWRVDIFSTSSGPPGNWSGAHHHINFRGDRPGRRCFDASLTGAPLAWLDGHLRDLAPVLKTAGADDLVPHVLHKEWERALPGILDAVSAYMQQGLEKLGAIVTNDTSSARPKASARRGTRSSR